MKLSRIVVFYIPLILGLVSQLIAQEQSSKPVLSTESGEGISKKGYEKTVSAVVKIVSDGGRKIGTGVILGVSKDGFGYVLTSHSTVEGLDKVAVILRNHPDALLGRIVDKWIDFDFDLAIVKIRNFPAGQTVVSFQDSKSAKSEESYLLIAHIDTGDWLPMEVSLANFDETKFALSLTSESGMEGAPIITNNGNMIGFFSSLKSDSLSLAVRTNAIKPIIDEWFSSVELAQKWEEDRTGIATWIWAVGGSVIGGTIVTAIAISGGDSGARPGLPRAPNPPPVPEKQR